MQRANLIDPGAPNPSVETLLHAFLPHKYVDHTHSTAVLAIADQPDAAERCADLYGGRMGLVPYIMPGFLLAKKAAEVFENDPAVEGLVLLKHGIFTFGDTAREAYERMIAAVSLAEERLARRRKTVFAAARLPAAVAASGRSGADPARRLRHRRPERVGRLQAVHPRIPLGPGGARLRQRRRASPLRTGRGRHPGSHDPHQELPADRAGTRAGQARRVQNVGARRSRSVRRRISCVFRPPQCAPGGTETRARPDAAGHPGAGARSVRARAQRPGRTDRRRHCAIDDRDRDRCRGGRPVRVGQRSRSLRHRILVAGTGEARPEQREAAGRTDRGRHRRRRNDRSCHRPRDERRRRGSGLARHRGRRGNGCGEEARRRRRSPSPAT